MGWLKDNFAHHAPAQARDMNGQPIVLAYRSEAVAERQIDELIGLVKGVLADGAICQGEVEFLCGWMESNRNAGESWPACAIYPRIAAALQDGHVDEEEEKELMTLLMSTVGSNTAPLHGHRSNSTSLPLCAPAPMVLFEHRTFCFTGEFNSGTRRWCEEQTHQRRGLVSPRITRKLDYLVIGEIGSRDWLHSTHGLKIKKAMEYRESGSELRIISEKHWYQHLAF